MSKLEPVSKMRGMTRPESQQFSQGLKPLIGKAFFGMAEAMP